MNPSTYKRVEDEYFRLRGQFDTDRLTKEQFDAALRELMIQDEQGRYWMIGADSGRWYYYDGTKWVQSDPYASVAAAPPIPTEPTPVPTAAPPPRVPPVLRGREFAPSPPLQTTSERGFPLVPLLVGVAVLLIALVVALLLGGGTGLPFLAATTPRVSTPLFMPTITRAPSTQVGVLPTVIVPSLAPIAPISTPTRGAATTPTVATDGPAPITLIPLTITPELPTITPLPIPSITVEASPTSVVVPTQIPSFPPSVYVTAMRVEPNPPKRNQPIAFTATFLNTTGETKPFNWLVLLYDPNKSGPNKGFGESASAGINVPPGTRSFTVTYNGVRGPGGCISLYVQANFQDANRNLTVFLKTNGEPFRIDFDVCP